jgi:hypothetical protein
LAFKSIVFRLQMFGSAPPDFEKRTAGLPYV